jgi:hypothetical protein
MLDLEPLDQAIARMASENFHALADQTNSDQALWDQPQRMLLVPITSRTDRR